MKNLNKPNYAGGPMICNKTLLPAFIDPKSVRDLADTMPAISVDAIDYCAHCEGYHGHTHCRPPSGATSGRSSRHDTEVIPDRVKRHNEILSKRR